MFTDTDGVMSEPLMCVYTAMVHTDCISICQAKRVKTEEGGAGKMSSKEVEAVVLGECKKHQQWLAPPVLPFSVPLIFSFPVPPCSLQPLPPRVSIRLSQGQAVKSESQLLACLYVCACVCTLPKLTPAGLTTCYGCTGDTRYVPTEGLREAQSLFECCTQVCLCVYSRVRKCAFVRVCMRACVHVCAWCV